MKEKVKHTAQHQRYTKLLAYFVLVSGLIQPQVRMRNGRLCIVDDWKTRSN